jgi:hypothetical protein
MSSSLCADEFCRDLRGQTPSRSKVKNQGSRGKVGEKELFHCDRVASRRRIRSASCSQSRTLDPPRKGISGMRSRSEKNGTRCRRPPISCRFGSSTCAGRAPTSATPPASRTFRARPATNAPRGLEPSIPLLTSLVPSRPPLTKINPVFIAADCHTPRGAETFFPRETRPLGSQDLQSRDLFPTRDAPNGNRSRIRLSDRE